MESSAARNIIPANIIAVATDFFDRYIEDRRQNRWGFVEASRERINAVFGANYFQNVPTHKIQQCTDLSTEQLNIKSSRELFDYIYKLGDEAEKAKNETTANNANASVLFYILHAVRSLYVNFAKTQLKDDYNKELEQLRNTIKTESGAIISLKNQNKRTGTLIDEQNKRFIKLCYLEDRNAIYQADDRGLLHNMPEPKDDKRKLPSGAEILVNIPKHLQPDLHVSIYNLGIRSSTNVEYPTYVSQEQYRLAKMTKQDTGDDYYRSQYDYKSQLICITEFFAPTKTVEQTAGAGVLGAFTKWGNGLVGQLSRWSLMAAGNSATAEETAAAGFAAAAEGDDDSDEESQQKRKTFL